MQSFMYSAWFRDEQLPADYQDHEWVCMFIIEAQSAETALAWGDRISHRYAARMGEPFIRSYLEDPEEYSSCLGFSETPRSIAGDESFDPLAPYNLGPPVA
jgi:hypothetical protein